MHADLDLLCISVYCTADDLLPERPSNARRRLSDAEIVTLCVAQVLMGIPSDRRFLRAARRQLGLSGTQIHPSCCSSVLVDESAESVVALEVADDRRTGGDEVWARPWYRWCQPEGAMRPVGV